MLPLLLLLLLGAVDFGRVFFGWVALTNASRVGADYAATHPDAWALGNVAQQDMYEKLITDSGATNCAMTISDPTFPDGSRAVGSRARVDLSCSFNLVTPLLQPLLGRPIAVVAESTFPVRRGCANCIAAPAGPPPPPSNNCRELPNMVGRSVDGARAAWVAAGFTGSFDPATADGWRTVSSQTVDQDGNPGCTYPWAFFSSSVFVTLAVIVEPAPGETCRTVPNLLGMTLTSARQAWGAAGFDPAAFTPLTGSDTQVVSAATYDPADATHGQCREPDLLITVQSVAPPAPPPAPPCKVPSFVNTLRSDAPATWLAAQFSGPIQYQPQASNWSLIGQQSLVGGSYAACSASIKLSR